MAEASITANDKRTAPPSAAPRHRAVRPASTRHPAAATPISKRVMANTHALTASLAPVRADLGLHCWPGRSAWRVLIGSLILGQTDRTSWQLRLPGVGAWHPGDRSE